MKENIKDNKENKESRRVQMTKKLLRESVIELMEQKPLNKISIKDICDNADVNRTTFYKYYGDQFELVKEAEDEVLEKLGEFLGNLKSDTLVISMLETFLYYIKENGYAYHILLNNSSDYSFSYRLMHVTLDKLMAERFNLGLDETNKKYLYNLIVMGAINTIDLWINRDFDTSVEELAELMYNFINSGIHAISK